jgi:phosphoserine phosphatase
LGDNPMKLCVFDFDSTLMDGETIDEIAAACDQKVAVSAITEAAMRGELDFFESLTQRAALLKGAAYDRVKAICENLPLMPGAFESVSALKKAGFKVIIFSGGFHLATAPACAKLGADATFANTLHHKDGLLSGQVGGEMMFDDSKGQMLCRLQGLLGVTRSETVVVGDGANDRSMFAHADTRIAFCAKPVLKKEASVVVEKKDLTEILPHIIR